MTKTNSKIGRKPSFEGTTASQAEQGVNYVFGRAGALPLDSEFTPSRAAKAGQIAKKTIQAAAPQVIVASALAFAAHLIWGFSSILYLIGYILGILTIEGVLATKESKKHRIQQAEPPLIEIDDPTVRQNSSEAGADMGAWDALVYEQYGKHPDVSVSPERIDVGTGINASILEMEEQIAILTVMSKIHALTRTGWEQRIKFMSQFDPDTDVWSAFNDSARNNAKHFGSLVKETQEQIDKLISARDAVLANLSISQVRDLKRSLSSITAGSTEDEIGRGIDRDRLANQSQRLIYQSEALIELRKDA